MPERDPAALLSERRIRVYGVTGAGRSTAAARLGAVTGLPVHLADRRPICNDNVETLRGVVSGDSIIAWRFRSFSRKARPGRGVSRPADDPVLRFRRPADLERWFRSLDSEPRTA